MYRLIFLTVVVLSGLSSLGAERAKVLPPSPPQGTDSDWCATGPDIVEATRQLHEWNRIRRPALALESSDRVLERDGIFYYEANDWFLPLRKRADLEGLTVTATPVEGGWALDRGPLRYREERGMRWRVDGIWDEVTVNLERPFRIGGASSEQITVTSRHGIWLGESLESEADQFITTDILALDEAVVSPLLISSLPATFQSPDLWIDQGEDLVISWVNDRGTEFTYDVQAVFHLDGSVSFNYRRLGDANWGSVVISDGSGVSAFEQTNLLLVKDGVDQIDEGPDLESLKIDRIGSTEIARFVIEVEDEIDREAIPDGDGIGFVIRLNSADDTSIPPQYLQVHLTNEHEYLYVPGWGWRDFTPSLDVFRRRVTFFADLDRLGFSPVVSDVYAYTSSKGFSDRIDEVGSVRLDYIPMRTLQSDLSEDAFVESASLLTESFTLGYLDPAAIWSDVRKRIGLGGDHIDSVAIYQNFFTDLILYAGAYSTVGNPQVEGIYGGNRSISAKDPKAPALLHMNRLRYRHNESDLRQGRVLAHELGHRWLYFFDIIENGERTQSLNPLGAHPAEFVHIPSAFPVYGSNESSTMGGAYFTDNGDGTWTAPNELKSVGFSWHELYLMGLAAPGEVEPWYYLANTEPRLGDVYYPPLGITVTGDRVDVTIDQIVDAMGPRKPDHAVAEKQFDMIYVLLVDDLDRLTEDDIALMNHYRENFRVTFARATGGRGSVTGNEPVESRRRGARR